MPSDICVATYVDGPKQRNGDPTCSMDMPLDIVQREFLRYCRDRGSGGSNPLHSIPICLVLLWGSWSDPDITTLKWACLQITAVLTGSPFVIIPITLSITLGPTMASTFSE